MKLKRMGNAEQPLRYEECPAKSRADGGCGTSVFDHCRYSGYVAEALLKTMPDPLRKRFPEESAFLVSVHDTGKVSPGFMGKYFFCLLEAKAPQCAAICRNGGFERNHAAVGADALRDMGGSEWLARIVSAHHGFESDTLGRAAKDGWQSERERLVGALANEFGCDVDCLRTCKEPERGLVSGLTCVSDWIASDEEMFPPGEAPLESVAGRDRAAKAVAECGFGLPAFRKGLEFKDVFGFEPYRAQRDFIGRVTGPGVYVLEAPMGMGKTEAALFAAYRLLENGKASGLYFALPTRLTSDKIHERVMSFLEAVSSDRTAVKLAHGQAWLKQFARWGEDVAVAGKPPPWFGPSKRGLLFPFAVGTIDQALMGVINVKHSFVREYALAGKVVILDEVHSYDTYTGTLLDELTKRLRSLGCTVVVLSATLTAARRAELIGAAKPSGAEWYPMVSALPEGTDCAIETGLEGPAEKKIALSFCDATEEGPEEIAVEKARAGCNVVCIVNTVADSQKWYRRIKSEMREGDYFPVGLLHSRFTGSDRAKIEDEWMARLGKDGINRPRGSILVATQVVEQSVDIDADWMVSEIAPADMLLQRMGRLWRHERKGRPVNAPEFMITYPKIPGNSAEITPENIAEHFGRGCHVYAGYVMLRTHETMKGRRIVTLPQDIRGIIEDVYRTPGTPLAEGAERLRKEMEKKARELGSYAQSAQAKGLPTKDDDEDTALTRYGSRIQMPLLVVRSVDEGIGGGKMAVEFTDGTRLEVPLYTCDMKAARILHSNVVRVGINGWIASKLNEDRRKTPKLVSMYFRGKLLPLICVHDAESGELLDVGTKGGTGYAYGGVYGAVRHEEGGDGDGLRNDGGEGAPLEDEEFTFSQNNDW